MPRVGGVKPRPVVAAPWVFYSEPYAPKGLWVRTDLSTVQADCSYCGSKQWEPCKTKRPGREPGRYQSSTHYNRRQAAKKANTQAQAVLIEVKKPGEDDPGYTISLTLPPAAHEAACVS